MNDQEAFDVACGRIEPPIEAAKARKLFQQAYDKGYAAGWNAAIKKERGD